MGTQLRPGSFSDTNAATMAKQIEAAFMSQWSSFNPDLPQPEGKQLEALRLFFVAVSQGVVQHLRDNAVAFEVVVDNGGVDLDGTVVEVNTTGTTA
jgi:hypothetical protein